MKGRIESLGRLGVVPRSDLNWIGNFLTLRLKLLLSKDHAPDPKRCCHLNSPNQRSAFYPTAPL